MAGATSDGRRDELCSLRLAVHASSKEEERTALDGKLRGVRERKRAASGRDCRRVIELAGDHSGGMGVGRTVPSRSSSVHSFEIFLTRN